MEGTLPTGTTNWLISETGFRIPTDFAANCRFRAAVLRRAAGDPDFQRNLWIACSRDIVLWVALFASSVDPRKVASKSGTEGPFIPWECQVDAIVKIKEALEKQYDLPILKSRDMGATWLCLLVFLWFFLFRRMAWFLVVSRVETDVDKKGDPGTLFWKIDYALSHLPGWMRPVINRTNLHIENCEFGGTIDGVSTQENTGRSKRALGILLDEYALAANSFGIWSSTGAVTGCRIPNSTPKGVGNAFHSSYVNSEHKLKLHWTGHPEKNPGLYTSTGGKMEILDKDYSFPDSYRFILDGKIRSPWYDSEEKRTATAQEMAQEHDCDFLGSGHQAFSAADIERYKKEFAKRPYFVGDLEYDFETLEPIRFTENPNGRLRLWINVDPQGQLAPQSQDFVAGADISMGTGASNSVLSVAGRTTREKVAEFASPYLDPKEHAEMAIALCKWFRGPGGTGYLIWENNGPGATFRKHIMLQHYGRIFYRRDERKAGPKVSNDPGWNPTPENKSMALSTYRSALHLNKFINRSTEALDECMAYVIEASGAWEHSGALQTTDPTGATKNHGDRVIADALVWWVLQEREVPKEPPTAKAPQGSFGWRREQFRKKQRDTRYKI